MSRNDEGPSLKRKRSFSPTSTKATTSSSSKANGSRGDHDEEEERTPAYWIRAQIGKLAPDFSDVPAVVNGTFKEISLKSYLGKYLVLLFYPQDFTYVCPTEIIAFSERIAEFRELATEVLAISVDSKYSHLAWINTARDKGGLGPVRVPLLSDITHKLSKDYGVFVDDLGHTIRGLFIIDAKGFLRHATLNDLTIGRSVDETKRVLEALQYNSEYGDVCPADWKPGKPSIVPTPDDSREYFKIHHK